MQKPFYNGRLTGYVELPSNQRITIQNKYIMENETKDIPLSEAAMSRVEKTQESVQKMQEQIQKAQQEMSAYLQGILDATGAPEGVNYQVDMEK